LTNAHKNNQIESFAKAYAKCFGRDGCEADMRWVLACPILTTPTEFLLSLFETPKTPAKHKTQAVLKEEFKIFSTVFVRAIVENALNSEDYFKRIHCLALWWGFSTDDIMRDMRKYYDKGQQKKLTEDDYEYWHTMRRLISIVYLFNGDEPFQNMKKNLDPKNISKTYDITLKRLTLFAGYVSYSPNQLKYEVTIDDAVLPSITKPKVPFPHAYYSNEKNRDALPRISNMIVRSHCIDYFVTKIFDIVEVKSE
jgi:hypothetical protein